VRNQVFTDPAWSTKFGTLRPRFAPSLWALTWAPALRSGTRPDLAQRPAGCCQPQVVVGLMDGQTSW